MNVSRFRILSIFLALVIASQVLGQEPGMSDARALLQTGRVEIIEDELRFTEEEAAAFWPVYDEYQSDLAVVKDQYADLVTSFLDAYRAGTVSDQFAEQLIDDYLDIQEELLKIKRKHLKDFRKALPARKAARFYQLENKMDAQLEAQLSLVIPMIDPV